MTKLLRVLLDENLPVKLKYRLLEDTFWVSTVRDQNWLGKKNGELLNLIMRENFDVFLTNDRHISYQQNSLKFPLVLLQINASSNRYEDLILLVPSIKVKLAEIAQAKQNGHSPEYLTIVNLD